MSLRSMGVWGLLKPEDLGIPCLRNLWTELAVKLLGTASDPAVGRMVERDATAVQGKRKRRGVQAFMRTARRTDLLAVRRRRPRQTPSRWVERRRRSESDGSRFAIPHIAMSSDLGHRPLAYFMKAERLPGSVLDPIEGRQEPKNGFWHL